MGFYAVLQYFMTVQMYLPSGAYRSVGRFFLYILHKLFTGPSACKQKRFQEKERLNK